MIAILLMLLVKDNPSMNRLNLTELPPPDFRQPEAAQPKTPLNYGKTNPRRKIANHRLQ